MTTCEYLEDAPFFCQLHQCGVRGDGRLDPCRREGCPHCGKMKVAPKANVPLLLKKCAAAQRHLEEWTTKNMRAASKVVEYTAEVRRLWKRLEQAGVHVDPMELVSREGEGN